jgi:hypothetical protein
VSCPLNWSCEAGKEANPVDWERSEDLNKKADGFFKALPAKTGRAFYGKNEKWLS